MYTQLHHVTVIVVSHEPPFLDAVCTDILHLFDRQLTSYKGDFSSFLKKVGGGGLLRLGAVSLLLYSIFDPPSSQLVCPPPFAVLVSGQMCAPFTGWWRRSGIFGSPSMCHRALDF